MKRTGKFIAVILAAAVVFGSCVTGLPGFLQITASALGISKPASVRSSDLTFIVPEAIYLYPDARSWNTSVASPFQYYVNNNQDGSVTAEASQTTGKIYYSLSGAGNAIVSYTFLSKDMTAISGGSVNLSSTTVTNGSYVNITGGASPSLASSVTGCYLQWCISYTDNGVAKKAYAYSYVYKPYTVPIAAAALAGTGTSSGANWAGSLTWLSGMHSIIEGGMPDYSSSSSLDSYEENNYLKFTEFSSFASPSNTAYVGGTAVTSTTRGVSSSSWVDHDTSRPGDMRYVSYANTSGTPKSFAYVLIEDNRKPTSYNNSGSDTTQNWGIRNTTYAEYRGNNVDIVAKSVAKSIGDIYVDTSRYTNLNQIPNLSVGLAVTMDKGCTNGTGRWWMADISETAFDHRSTWYKTDEDGLRPAAMERDYIFAGQGSDWHTRSYDTNEGLRYAGSWNRSLMNTAGATSQMYYVKSLYGNSEKSAGRNYDANAVGYVGLRAEYYNKTYLRAAVQYAVKKMAAFGVNGVSGSDLTSCYFDADSNYKWTAFQTAFTEAYKALTLVDGSIQSPDVLSNNLYNAINALCTYYEFDANGGTLSMPQNGYVTVGANQYASVVPAVTASRQGYTFKGWSTDPDCDPSNALTGNIQVGYNNEIYAIWKANSYFISFITNSSETIIPNQILDYGQPIVRPADPVRTGYTFTGWEPEIPATMPYSNVTVTAQWSVNQYTISFNTGDGATQISPITQDYDTDIIPPASPERTGYTFAGWSPALPSKMPAYNKTHNALWNVNIYSVTYDSNGGSAVPVSYIAYDANITSPAPSRTGYHFNGWTYRDADNNIYSGSTMPAYNLTATANWSKESYTITYNSAGGTEIAPRTFEYEAAITLPADPVKTGYNFAGWVYTDSSDNVYSGSTMPAYNLTATAQWNAKIHTIRFFDGETLLDSQILPYGSAITAPDPVPAQGKYFTYWTPAVPAVMEDADIDVYANWANETYNLIFNESGYSNQSVTYGSQYPVVADPVKEGYTFGGWFTDSACTAGHEISFTGSVPDLGDNNANINIYAKWTVNTYTVTFVTGEGATVIPPVTGNYGESVPYPADPVRPGYDFIDWDPNVPDTIPAYDLTITAIWEAQQFCLSYYVDGESYGTPEWIDCGEAITVPASPEVEGCTFGGWAYFNDETGSAIDTPTVMPAHDVRGEAILIPLNYTITFTNTGDSVIAPITQPYGSAVTAPSDPVKEGYTFGGWSPSVPQTMPAGDLTVAAVWNINTHTITFANTGDTVIPAITGEYGSSVTAPADPVWEGHEFIGWDRAIPQTMPDEDLTVTALWNVNQYTITFADTGDSVIDPVTQPYGSAVTAPSDPVKEGYTFAGWSREIPTTMPAENLTITAQWNINQYTITFADTGDSVIDPITLDYGSAVTAPADPVKEGHTFAGWSREIPTTMPAENLTITAQWNIRQFTITFADTGDSVIPDITLDYGADIPSVESPVRAGYDFGGWDTEIPSTMPAEDLTVTALWNIHTYRIVYVMDGGAPQQGTAYAEYNSVIDLPQAGVSFVREGYTFAGWSYDGSVYTDTFTVPAMAQNSDEIRLTALWNIASFTITFDTDGGSEISPVTQEYGTAVSAPENPVKPGYRFIGWTPSVPSTMPGADMTVRAEWEKLSYRVAFLEPDSISGVPSFENRSVYDNYETYLSYGDGIPDIPADGPAVNYYVFTGWSDTQGGEPVDLSAWAVPAGDPGDEYIFYPVYEREEIALNIISQSSDADIVVPAPSDPDYREGVDGYIYNAGTKLNKAALAGQLKVSGDGSVVITPSKGSQICGTGTKIELKDNYDGSVIKTYYLIVPGDVNGDSICSANDLSIAEHARSQANPTWYLKDKADADQAEIAANAVKRHCYRLAADVNDQYGEFNDDDTSMISLYVLGGAEFSYDPENSKYTVNLA